VVSIFANQLLRGERRRIFGDGTKTRDYVYVDDIVEANLRALQYKRNSNFNLGRGTQITDLQFFQTVRNAIDVRLEPIFYCKRPGKIERICLDASRSKPVRLAAAS
jgi:UDP-glucose 4-epimerase